MPSIDLTLAWLREEIDKVEAHHEKYVCPRCKGRGFRVIRWWPCQLCAGYGRPRVNLVESANRMRELVALIEYRVTSLQHQMGFADQIARHHDLERDGRP